MKTKLMKILILTFVFAFLSASASMAGERQGNRKRMMSNKAQAHHKVDRHQNYGHGGHFRKNAPARHYGKHYGPKHYYKHHKRSHYHRRPVRHQQHHHYYHGARGYPAYNSFSFGLAVFDPNMAFSIGVNGR